MGYTLPSLLASGLRLLIVAIAITVFSAHPDFHLEWIWYIALAAVFVQLLVSLVLLRQQFRERLVFAPVPVPAE